MALFDPNRWPTEERGGLRSTSYSAGDDSPRRRWELRTILVSVAIGGGIGGIIVAILILTS